MELSIWYNCTCHPQNNFTERTNRTIGAALRSYIGDNHRHWDRHIPKIQLAIGTAVHAVTGYNPFYLNHAKEFAYHGLDYVLSAVITDHDGDPVNKKTDFLRKIATISDDIAKRMLESYKRQYDSNKIVLEFNVGDKVYKRNFAQSNADKYFSAKLAPRIVPCIITAKHSAITYSLRDELTEKDLGRWHVRYLKPAIERFAPPGDCQINNPSRPFSSSFNNFCVRRIYAFYSFLLSVCICSSLSF